MHKGTQEKLDVIRAMLNDYTWQQIGDKIGMSRQGAHHLWKMNRTPGDILRRRGVSNTARRHASIAFLLSLGFRVREVAEELGLSVSVVFQVSKFKRLRRRGRRESTRRY